MANVWYDQLDRVPPRGSLEWILALGVWVMRRDQEYLFRYAQMLSVQNNDDAKQELSKVWSEFSDNYFPYAQKSGEDKRRQLLEKAGEEFEKMAGKPLIIKPLALRRK